MKRGEKLMPADSFQITLSSAIFAVALSDISLAFDNALANSQMAAGLPRQQQRRALIFGMLLSCGIMIVMTFAVVELRSSFDWIRYPAGLWLLYVVFQLWFARKKEYSRHAVVGAMRKAVLLIAVTDLSMATDNAIANSEFALRASYVVGNVVDPLSETRLWAVLICGLLLSCVFMIACTYTIVWVRRFADWIRYPAGAWLLYVAILILGGKGSH